MGIGSHQSVCSAVGLRWGVAANRCRDGATTTKEKRGEKQNKHAELPTLWVSFWCLVFMCSFGVFLWVFLVVVYLQWRLTIANDVDKSNRVLAKRTVGIYQAGSCTASRCQNYSLVFHLDV